MARQIESPRRLNRLLNFSAIIIHIGGKTACSLANFFLYRKPKRILSVYLKICSDKKLEKGTAMNKKIKLRVNGKKIETEVPTNRLMIDFIRYDLGLTGTKEGCSVGVCGACTVLMDGDMVSSCLALAVFADGHDITTVEGLAKNGELHPVQKSFIQYGGFQCGICTPGQVVAAKALLDENPRPNEEEIKDWMMGNLCRCTGYYKIIESIQKAHQFAK
jgi:aerobic carbon-monoxide dehydrogenase small subunit